jgi:tetratricopeptide (TPR) repeat protein
MTGNRIATQIENLIRKSEWAQARIAIQKQLVKEPDDHWLWSRLSAVKYEQRDYQGALEAAEKALKIVPDCPLALWSYAGAVEMLGEPDEAKRVYSRLFHRGRGQLKNPDEDAKECWEGPDWTAGLMADCMFRIAGCLAKAGQRANAVEVYREFLSLHDLGVPSIYSRADALTRLKKLMPSKNARRRAVVKVMEKELIPR